MKGKKVIWALILLGLSGILLILNRTGSVTVQLPFYSWATVRAAAFLAFIALGVVIGLLLSK